MTSTSHARDDIAAPPADTRRAVAIVIPVRDAAELLDHCLASILPQLAPGDEIVVVDDGSTDHSADTAERQGATVLRHDAPSGPYAARNAGWRTTEQPIVAFTDVRCRARPGWLAATRAAFADGSVAMVCSDVETLDGPTRAAKVMRYRQTFRTRHTATSRQFLPFFPTCNLAVRRSALEAVDGFSELRSGADADLCWRIQLAGPGRLHVIDRTTMDWVPRRATAALLEQWSRYGRSQAQLRLAYTAHGLDPTPPTRLDTIRATARSIGVAYVRQHAPLDVALLSGAATWHHSRSLARELRRGGRHGGATPYRYSVSRVGMASRTASRGARRRRRSDRAAT